MFRSGRYLEVAATVCALDSTSGSVMTVRMVLTRVIAGCCSLPKWHVEQSVMGRDLKEQLGHSGEMLERLRYSKTTVLIIWVG